MNLILLEAANAQGGGMGSILMILALVVVFYLFMIRPQQKKQKQIKQFRENLSKGDNVITAGGIYGKICEIREGNFVVQVADGVKLTIDKGSVYPSAAEAAQAQQQQQPQK